MRGTGGRRWSGVVLWGMLLAAACATGRPEAPAQAEAESAAQPEPTGNAHDEATRTRAEAPHGEAPDGAESPQAAGTPASEAPALPETSDEDATRGDGATQALPEGEAKAPALDPAVEARVDALLARMSVEDKIGQLLFVGFGGKEVEAGGPIERLVRGRKVGGVALFSRNVSSIPQVARFTRQIAALLPDLPPFLAVDQEGGNVVRLENPATVLPGNMALGATRDAELTLRAAASQARDLHLIGFNMNLAPVLDVNSNPNNPVIGIRSFGEEPRLVSEHGAAYVAGLQSAGVAAVAKHFPGHGDTQDDSHFALPSLPHDRERLLAVELAPFAAAVEAGLDAVMTAHIALPAVEGEPQVPATVSHKVLTGLLRETLGFEGIIITDGLEMKGIVERYGSGAAAVRAVQAGADMVLILWTKEKKEEVYQALLTSVSDGTISGERLDTSVRRILRVKVRRGILDDKPAPLVTALKELGRGASGLKVSQEIADRALTLVRSRPGLTPLHPERHRKIVVLSADRVFAEELARLLPGVQTIHTPAVPSRPRRAKDLERALLAARGADVVVVALVNRYQALMVKRLLAEKVAPVVAVSLGSPYLLTEFPGVDAYVCTYSYRDSAARSAARYLAGKAGAPGRLPVSLPGLYSVGHGGQQTTEAVEVRRTAATVAP